MQKRKIVLTLLVIAILFSICSSANAYTIGHPWRYSSGTLNVYYAWGSSMPSDSVWKTAFSTAASDWTGTFTVLSYNYSSSAVNKLGVVSIAGGSYGYAWTTSDSEGYIISFSAAGNTATTGSFTSTMRRSTAGHELGHGAGLGEGNVAQALMYQGRDRSKIYTPQTDDVQGINSLY